MTCTLCARLQNQAVQRGASCTCLLLLRSGVRRRFRCDARAAGIARRYLPITPGVLPDIDDEEIATYVFALETGLLLIEEAHDGGFPEPARGQAPDAICAHPVGGSGGLEPVVP